MTRAIRLSFHTNRPFYPYSEPSDRQQANAASPGGRALRVDILSNERMTGGLANATPWPARLEFSGPSAPQPVGAQATNPWIQLARLGDAGPDKDVPMTLTSFIDESNPRPGTADLYFSPDPDQRPFRGEAVDFTMQPQDKLVISDSFADIGALFALIIIPGVPLYCGWNVLHQEPDEEIRPRKPRFPIPRPPSTARPPKPWVTAGNRFVAMLAIVLGVFYGGQLALLLLGETASAFLGWTDTGNYWIWFFAGIILAAIPASFMAWGLIYCGVNVWRNQKPRAPLRPTSPFFVGGAWQGFMAALSLLTGSIASLAVLGIFVWLL